MGCAANTEWIDRGDCGTSLLVKALSDQLASWQAFALALGLVGLAACGSSETEIGNTERDSAGIRIVTTAQTSWRGPVRAGLRPVLEVPARGDESAPDLSRVTAAELLPNGSVAVLDSQLSQVVIFDSNGETAAIVGRSGQAPGEFLGPVSLDVTREGLIRVYDARLGRMTDISADGTVVDVFTLPPSLFPRPPNRVWRLEGQRVLAWEYDRGGQRTEARSGGAARVVIPGLVRVVDLNTGTSDTLYTADAREMIGEGPRIWVAPFGVSTAVEFRGDRLYLTTGRRHEIVVIDPTDGVTELFRYPDADEALSEEELSRLRDDARTEATESNQPLPVMFLFDEALQPEGRPAFERLQVAADGRIWARRFMPFREPSGQWWFLSEDGVFLGQAEFPGTSEILAVGDGHFVVLTLDEFELPSVRVVEIPEEMR